MADEQQTYIDLHARMLALPNDRYDCLVSEELLQSREFKYWRKKLNADAYPPEQFGKIYAEYMSETIQESRYVDRVVVCAEDGVYARDGEFQVARTRVRIPNKYVFSICRTHEGLVPGASVHPFRKDRRTELAQVAENGAVLVKLAPEREGYHLNEPALKEYYKLVGGLELPLLVDGGNPEDLRNALELGLKVIWGPTASWTLTWDERRARQFIFLARTYPNLYWESSSLTLPGMARTALMLANYPETRARMYFSTGFPSPVFALNLALHVNPWNILRIMRTRNPFDKQLFVLQGMGLPLRSVDIQVELKRGKVSF